MNVHIRDMEGLSYIKQRIKCEEFRLGLSQELQDTAVLQFWIESFFFKQDRDDILNLYDNLSDTDKKEVFKIMQAICQTCLREDLSLPDIFIEVYESLGGEGVPRFRLLGGVERTFLRDDHALVFSILLSHGFSSKDMAYLRMPLTLKEQSLLQWPILPLLLEFRDIYKPRFNSYCQSGFYEPERGFAYLWRIHSRIPLIFRHSERCFYCLHDSLYSNEARQGNRHQGLYYCPFDLDKTNPFDSLKAVAQHLCIPKLKQNADNFQACLEYCSHMKAREFQRGIPILAVLHGDAYMKSHFRPV